MPPRSLRYSILLLGVALVLVPRHVSAVGAYQDLGRFSAFLRAPMQSSLDGRVTRAYAQKEDAAIFFVGAHIPARSRLLFQLEISYASIVRGTVIDNGFGDFRVRARTEVWGGDSWSVPAYAGLRVGSGSDEVFPYGTKSIDWELSKRGPARKYTTKKEEKTFRETYRRYATELIPARYGRELASWSPATRREFWERLDRWARM